MYHEFVKAESNAAVIIRQVSTEQMETGAINEIFIYLLPVYQMQVVAGVRVAGDDSVRVCAGR